MSGSAIDTDARAAGLVAGPVAAARYEGGDIDPYESSGIIVSLVPRGGRVLDVGCGTGKLSAMIRDECGAEVTGIEPHPDRARAASERGLTVLNAGFGPEAAGELGRFDAVVFADVLEHLVEPAGALSCARSLLNPGGVVIASVPNVAHWTVRLDLLRGRFEYQPLGIMDATHLRWFTRRSLTGLFERSGFRVESMLPTAGAWMPEYRHRRPWRWLKPRWRDGLVRRAAKRLPGLFGCQIVVKATAAAGEARPGGGP